MRHHSTSQGRTWFLGSRLSLVWVLSAAISGLSLLAISVDPALSSVVREVTREPLDRSELPFGTVRVGQDPGAVGFAGARRESNSGLVYLRNRWYDPNVGRFLSRDPIGFQGGWNLYGYARNRPTVLRDPSGKFPWLGVVGALVADYVIKKYVAPWVREQINPDGDESDGQTIDETVDRAVDDAMDRAGSGINAIEDSSGNELREVAKDATKELVKNTIKDAVGKSVTEGSSDEDDTFVDQMTQEEAERYERYWSQDYRDPYRKKKNTRDRRYAAPGTRSIRDRKLGKNGDTYDRETIYDQYGRKIGTNDCTNHGRGDHPNPHHHSNPWQDPDMHGRFIPGLHPQTPE